MECLRKTRQGLGYGEVSFAKAQSSKGLPEWKLWKCGQRTELLDHQGHWWVELMNFLFTLKATEKKGLSSSSSSFLRYQATAIRILDFLPKITFYHFQLPPHLCPHILSRILISLRFFSLCTTNLCLSFLAKKKKNYSCWLDYSFPTTFLLIERILSHLSRPSGSIIFPLKQNRLQSLLFQNRAKKIFILQQPGILNKAKR